MNEIVQADDLQCFIDELIQFKTHVQDNLNKLRMMYYWNIGKMIVDFIADKTHKELYGKKIFHTCGISIGIADSLIYDAVNYYEAEPDFEESRIKYRNWSAVKLAMRPAIEQTPHVCNTFKTIEICTECHKQRKQENNGSL
jgi:hypothetical protein